VCRRERIGNGGREDGLRGGGAGRGGSNGRKRTSGEEADGLRHGGLEEATVGGVCQAVSGESLAEGEEYSGESSRG
jgi:hypothetical protein